MPRIARVIVPNYPHHVVQKGTDGMRIFHNDKDRYFFLKNLRECLEKTAVKIWAYCLMDNHFHLLLVPQDTRGLGKCLHGVTFVYAQYYNSTYERTGRLWQNRYFSCPVDMGQHLWIVARYIERNPVRAKIVNTSEQWHWSSAHFRIEKTHDRFGISLSEWLNNEEDAKEYSIFLKGEGGEDDIRKVTLSGRPFGDLEFYKKIGQLLGKDLLPKRAGRPKIKNMGVVPNY